MYYAMEIKGHAEHTDWSQEALMSSFILKVILFLEETADGIIGHIVIAIIYLYIYHPALIMTLKGFREDFPTDAEKYCIVYIFKDLPDS